MVVESDAFPGKVAVVVPLEDTLVAGVAVVRPGRGEVLAERTEIPTWLRDDWQSRAATRGVHGQSVEEVHHRVDEEEGH